MQEKTTSGKKYPNLHLRKSETYYIRSMETLQAIRKGPSDHLSLLINVEQNRTMAMIDSGATGLFLVRGFVEKNRVTLTPLRQPLTIYNIDGTHNEDGSITHFACLKLRVDNQESWHDFLVTNLGGEDVILGLPWLKQVNPEVD